MGQSSCVWGWRKVKRGGSIPYGFYGSIIPSKRIGYFSLLVYVMFSMRRTKKSCSGPSGFSFPVARGLHLTATNTGPLR